MSEMEGAEKCDDKLNEAKETGNRNELTVDGVIKRPSLRKDSLFLTRKRLSKSKSEMDYEAVDSIKEDVDTESNNLCGSSVQIDVDEPFSEYGNTRGNKIESISKKQRHVVIVEEKLRDGDIKVPENEKSDQK